MSDTVPSITAARMGLEALLTAAGVPVVPNAGQLVGAPSAAVYAGDPWLEPLPSLGPPVRRARWIVRLVGGLTDRAGTLDQLAVMLALSMSALAAARVEVVDGRVSGPRQLLLAEASYLAVDIGVRVLVDLAAPPAPLEV